MWSCNGEDSGVGILILGHQPDRAADVAYRERGCQTTHDYATDSNAHRGKQAKAGSSSGSEQSPTPCARSRKMSGSALVSSISADGLRIGHLAMRLRCR